MSQVIRISETTYKSLASLARGFDTPGSVIDRLLDFYEKHHISSDHSPKPFTQKVSTKFTIPEEPDLTHTKVLEGRFGNEKVKNWMDLVYAAHKYALKHFGNIEALQQATLSNIVKGSLNRRGYHEYPDIGISIQGEDANDSWHNALHLAREISVSGIEVLFRWRNKKGAAHPGQKGRLFWDGQKLNCEIL
jgi:hypothetical protein